MPNQKPVTVQELELNDGSGRHLILIENHATQTTQISLKHGKKRIWTTTIINNVSTETSPK